MRKNHVWKKTAAILAAALIVTAAGCGKTAEKEKAAAPAEATAAAKTEEVSEAQEEAAEGAEEAGETILVAAAASLKNAYEEELIPLFLEKNPGIKVEGTYDSSGKLQTQIEEGMKADVFMSAAVKQMKALDEEGMIASDTITDLLENQIVLVVPEGNEQGLQAFEDIEKAEAIALGDPESVPAGQYAREALTSLGIWDGIQDKVSLGTNVTEVLNQVAEASTDAGIVYATDAASMEDKVDVIAAAPEGSLSQKVIYPVAVIKDSEYQESAEKFVEFLKSDEAMKIFESYGFTAGK